MGAAGVVLLILGLHFRSGSDTPAQPPAAPAVTAPASKAGPAAVSPTVSAPVSKVASKSTSKQVSTPPQAAAKPSPAGERMEARQTTKNDGLSHERMWRVIAFTFRTRAAAAKKVEQINQRHPRLEAAVFAPKEKQGYYLVALGGRMSREEALRMEKKALGEHVARDVYVQNYAE